MPSHLPCQLSWHSVVGAASRTAKGNTMEIQVTTREAATALRVSVRTAQRWAAQGKLPAAKVAGRWAITLTADVAGFKPFQLDKAREVIEQGGILPTSRPSLFTAVSSDGSTTYLVARE